MTTVVSPAGSFAGYSVREYLVRNKAGIKMILAAVFAYLVSLLGMVANPALNVLLSVAIGAAGKMAADAVDFWLSAVPVPTPSDSVSPAAIAAALKRDGNG